MLDSFGARLRQRREEQGIDLIAIAAQTKIKLSLLEGLERDDVSHWPAGIYRRAYIRAYAQAIGLNPDDVVRELAEVHPEPADIDAAAALAAAVESARTNAAPPTRLRNIMGSALGSLARLRRSQAVENLVVADGGWVNLSGPSTQPAPVAPPILERETPALADAGRDAGAGQPTISSEADPDWSEISASEEADLPEEMPATPPAIRVATAVPAPPVPVQPEPDFLAIAHLCTELGRVEHAGEMQSLLQEAAVIVDATGVIVWVWDAEAPGLTPALAHGYSRRLLAQLPTVPRDADNATAAAFRSARTCAIDGNEHASAALVVPLLTPGACAGVLAIELQHGREHTASLRAAATIIAAQLAQLVGTARPAEAAPDAELTAPPPDAFAAPALRTGAQG